MTVFATPSPKGEGGGGGGGGRGEGGKGPNLTSATMMENTGAK